MDHTANRRLVLASASPARLRLLRQAGFDPEVVVSNVDESRVGTAMTRKLVVNLARLKAEAVAARVDRQAVVIGCDSMFEFDGEPMGKPATVDEARTRLLAMRGQSGTLHTGHSLVDPWRGRCTSQAARTEVRFGDYTHEELDAYLATGEALQVAGGFTLDGRSAPFIAGVEGDPSTVIGLSLPLFRQMLSSIGLSVVDLWS